MGGKVTRRGNPLHSWPILLATFICRLRRLLPPIQAGRSPGASRLTPDENLLLVVNQDSDDLAVIRVRTQSLLTLIPVGPSPRDLAILLYRSR